MRERDYLVLRRGDSAWGIACSTVRALTRAGDRIAVATVGRPIEADAVLGVAARFAVSPAGPILRRFWPEPCAGLGIWAGVPVVVVDAGDLPHPLRQEEGDHEHA
jgi:hypothetical protein